MDSASCCKHFRTKAMYIPALATRQPGQGEEQVLGTSHCWCNCTLTETGPDDRPVGVEHCRPSRSCFKE